MRRRRSLFEASTTNNLTDQIKGISRNLTDPGDLDPLIDAIGDSRYVLLGEASHGTSEFYAWRARITQRLMDEKGFSFMAVEGDWPDCYRVNRYVKNYPDSGEDAHHVVDDFQRWPTWMWANWEIIALVEWMREYNKETNQNKGFFGLDVYSLWESMESIIKYLEEKDPEAVRLAKEAYSCFEPYGGDEQAYAWSTRMVPENCEDEVIDLLVEMQKKREQFASDPEAAFGAEQNARIMVDAERYYRAMVRSDSNSWNIRDIHMIDTLDRLMDFHGPDAKGIVWAHNTHVGDARATDMAQAGMVNIGQMARERHDDEGVFLAGFSSYRGSVIAGNEWGAPMERMPVPEGREGSWEEVLHRAGANDKLLLLGEVRGQDEFLEERGHRAIGVVYHPDLERYGNYVPTTLPERYDALLYIDETAALHPLHIQPEEIEPPETYPWGL